VFIVPFPQASQLDWKLDLFVQLNAYWKHIWKKSVAVSEEKSGNLCCHCEGNGRKCYLSVQIQYISILLYILFCNESECKCFEAPITPKADDNCFITSESNEVLSNMFWLKGDTHVGTHYLLNISVIWYLWLIKPKHAESETVAFSQCLKSAPVIGNSLYVCSVQRMFHQVVTCVPHLQVFSMFCKWGGRYFGEVYQGTIKGIMLQFQKLIFCFV